MTDHITTTEAGRRLGVSQARVRRLLLDGRLKGQHLGRDWLVSAASVHSFKRLPPGRKPKRKRARKREGKIPPRSLPAVAKDIIDRDAISGWFVF